MITRIVMPDFTVLSFRYDALGRRVYKQVTSIDESVTTTYLYGLGNSPLIDIVEGGISEGCISDLDSNGVVDLSDAVIFVSCYQGGYGSLCDLYPDGVLTLTDVVVFAGGFGCIDGALESDWRVDEVCQDLCRNGSFEVKSLFGEYCDCGKPLDIEIQEAIPE